MVLTLLLASVACGCAPQAATRARISTADEIDLARRAAPGFVADEGGFFPDTDVQRYVQEVGLRIARRTERPDLPWTFGVIDSAQLNAYALPGGYVYITRGLLCHLDDEAQLAAVLAHEAGHVAHRDAVRQLERILDQKQHSGSTAPPPTLAPGYSQAQEQAADTAALAYLVAADYNPCGLPQSLHVIEQFAQDPGSAAYLSDHPATPDRERTAADAIRRQYPTVTGRTGRVGFEQSVSRRCPHPRPG